MVKAEIIDQAGEPHAGEFQVDDYTWSTAAARSHGQARAGLERNHAILDTAAITTLSGIQIQIPHALLGDWAGVQIGEAGHDDWRWSLQAYQIGQLLNHLTVPPTIEPFRNVPPGIIAREALRRALADAPAGVPLYEGWFSESPPIVEEFAFTDQTVGAIFGQLMDLSGQEYQISTTGRVDWVAAVGDYYPTVLTEGYDFVLLSFDPAEDAPVRRVIVTDQRGEQATADAPEHATNVTARVVRQRADTVNVSATRAYAEGLLAVGRVVPTVYTIGLLPKGGTIAITLPWIGGGGSLALIWDQGQWDEGSFDVGVEASSGTANYPIIDAPHWSGIREGDFVRLIAPTADLRGRSDLCRVLARTFGDQHHFPVLQLVSVPQWAAATVQTARDVAATYSPPERIERMLVTAGQSAGPAVDTARLNSQLEPYQVPIISELNGTAAASQVPPLQDLTGAVTAAQVPSGGVVADAAAAPTQAEFNALTAALRTAGVID